MSDRPNRRSRVPTAYERYLVDVRALSRRRPPDGPDGKGAPAASREALVESHLFYVVRIAREYGSFGLPFDDLLSEGNVGLIEAAERFDPSRGTRFITYASWWIRKRILNLLARQINVIRLPKYKVERLRRLRRAEARLGGRLGRAPADEELSRDTGLPLSEIDNLRVLGQPELSLDHVLNDESGRKVGDSVSDDPAAQQVAGFIEQDYEAYLARVLESLPEKERFVVRHRFGFGSNKAATLQAIAEKLGLSRERVRQIELRALERIRRILQANAGSSAQPPGGSFAS